MGRRLKRRKPTRREKIAEAKELRKKLKNQKREVDDG